MQVSTGNHDTVGPQMDTVNTMWGLGGVFLQETMWNSETGVGLITTLGPNGELTTKPFSHRN